MSVSCPFPGGFSANPCRKVPDCFILGGVDETKRDANETISGVGEDVRKLVMVTNPANE